MKKVAFVALLVLCAGICCNAVSSTSIPLGDGLPDWLSEGVYTAKAPQEFTTVEGLAGIYTADADSPVIYVYRLSKADGISLEEFGQQMGEQHHVFCNMMNDRGVSAAVLNYYDCYGDEPFIVQAYIYETEDHFVEVRTLFRTVLIPFGGDDLFIHMINEYEEQVQKDSSLLSDAVYRTANEKLPQLRIRRFPKAEFPVEIVEPALLDAVSAEEVAALAADEWMLDEFVTIYDKRFELLKGEVTCRNDLDHAFVGYIDDGVFHTRAFIDDGEVYILLSAQAEFSRFQHVTNALIDAVERSDN